MYLLHRKKIDIYANVSQFFSLSEVTVSRSDGESASRDNPYSPERQRSLGHIWRFSTAWYDSVRFSSVRHGTGRFAFPLQFSTALEWAGLFTCHYSLLRLYCDDIIVNVPQTNTQQRSISTEWCSSFSACGCF